MTRPAPRADDRGQFEHEAFLYRGDGGFLAGTTPFIQAGLAAGERVLVAVNEAKIKLLRSALGEQARAVSFADMTELGRNPARMIPAWQQFIAECSAAGRVARGVGEPMWAARRAAEITECEVHETLLNAAFDGARWRLQCPYDADALDEAMIDRVCRSHPILQADGDRWLSTRYLGTDAATRVLDGALSEPATSPESLPFDRTNLAAVRDTVAGHAGALGIDGRRASELALAAHEIATNSLRHGGGRGFLRIWSEPEAMICEIRDSGHIKDPLVGRELPPPGQEGGRGVWLANQLCDLVQVRSSLAGTVIRLHALRGGAPEGADTAAQSSARAGFSVRA
jgi:anti-sigma regulatory factor (Ser/Thr protein kinase)